MTTLCTICDITMNTPFDFAQHIKGIKHRRMIAFQEGRLEVDHPGTEYCNLCKRIATHPTEHAENHAEDAAYELEEEKRQEWDALPEYCDNEDCSEYGRWFCAVCDELVCVGCVGPHDDACCD